MLPTPDDRLFHLQRRADRPRRCGMSMLELMLVLALLVALSALSLPAFRGSFDNHRLRKAGELIQVYFNKARIKAMKTGQIHMFQYQAEQNTFSVTPYYNDQDVLELDAVQESAMNGGGGGTATPLNASPGLGLPGNAVVEPRPLPDGVAFALAQVASDMRSVQTNQQMQMQNMNQLATQENPPILFYPDGTTSDARIALVNGQKYYVTVTLRSLTGLAKVSDVVPENVFQQQQ